MWEGSPEGLDCFTADNILDTQASSLHMTHMTAVPKLRPSVFLLIVVEQSLHWLASMNSLLLSISFQSFSGVRSLQ